MEHDRTVFLTFSNIWNLLNFWRALSSGYDVQLFGDVTSKASTAALNKLGFGVNMLGNRFAPLSFTMIPAETESSAAYSAAYEVTKSAVRRVIKLRTCSSADCKTCTYISGLQDEETVQCCLRSRPYREDKELPISVPLGDNSSAWQKFCREDLHLDANVCQTHATAIAKNNGTHRAHFGNMETYQEFYDYVCRIMRCSFDKPGRRLQALLVEWLRSRGETGAAEWFERYWCGDVTGRWLLGHGGIGMSANNQGLESKWHWDRMAISRGYQVRGQNATLCGQNKLE